MKKKKKRNVREKKEPVDILKSLMGEMYDKLAAKIVVALYREKQRLLDELARSK